MQLFVRESRHLLLVLLGIASAAMGLKGFLLSSNFIDGGVTGISMLLAKVTPIRLAIWLPVVNAPFIAVAWKYIGRGFAIRSALAIVGLALALVYVPFPDVTPDHVLTSVFGGFFIGAGIGLAVRGNAVLDGTEIAALLISKRTHVLSVGDIILCFNVVLFLIALSVLGVEPALYSILTYFTAAKTLDFVIYGVEAFMGITIISPKSAAIRESIIGSLGRGVTIFKGAGGMKATDQDILYCVVTRLEMGEVRKIISALDSNAFVTMHSLVRAEGGILKRKLK